MAIVFNDRVRESSSTVGTGTLTLNGPVAGFQSFSVGIGNSNTCYYAIESVDGNGVPIGPWEVGLGTVGAGTLSRDTVYQSSNSDNLVDFSGALNVFCTVPSEYLNGLTTDHGSLSGLSDDDHPQYILKNGNTTTTASIPFAEGLSAPDTKKAIFGTTDNGAINFDGTDLVIDSRNSGSTANTVFTHNIRVCPAVDEFSQFGATATLQAATNAVDRLYVTKLSGVSGVRSGMFVAEYNGSGGGSFAYQGLNAFSGTASGSTGNLTISTAGGSLRNRYVISHNGGGTVTLASAVSSIVNSVNGGTITDAVNFNAEGSTSINGTNAVCFWARTATTSNSLTNWYGLKVDAPLSGTNQYQIGLDSVGVGTGVYFNTPSAAGVDYVRSETAGNIVVNGDTTAVLAVGGTAKLTASAASVVASVALSATNLSGTNTGDQTFAGIFPWTTVTGTSQSMAVNAGYVANNSSLVTITLPTTAAVNSIQEVKGMGSGGWRIAQNSGQQIIWNEGGVDGTNETTIGTGGRLDSDDDYAAIRLICLVANTTWGVLSSHGRISLT